MPVACPSTAGTLRDQLIYPDSKEEMLAKGVSDTDLMQLLSLVDPPGIIVDRWTFDTEANWSLTLSGGQKQRVAMARLVEVTARVGLIQAACVDARPTGSRGCTRLDRRCR